MFCPPKYLTFVLQNKTMRKCSNCNIILSPQDEICPKCGFKIITEVEPDEEKPKSFVKKVIEHPKSLKITIYSIIIIIFIIVIWWIIRAVDSQYEYYKLQDKKTENKK